MAVAPNNSTSGRTTDVGHSGVANVNATPNIADSQPIDINTWRGFRNRSATCPQPMRPATPPSVAAVNAKPAGTSDQCSVSVR
jgi:hypothetical protein